MKTSENFYKSLGNSKEIGLTSTTSKMRINNKKYCINLLELIDDNEAATNAEFERVEEATQ